ncbi:MAG: HAMP domain-containing sensor histidine kinase [Bacteroidales bacterium]|jgi:signal transduction histidine kinase
MEIRQKITCQFTAIVAVLMLITILTIYFSFSGFRKEEFFNRLANKAKSVGQLIDEVDHFDAGLILRVERNIPTSLPRERIIVYNDSNETVFASDGSVADDYHDELIREIRLKKELKFNRQSFEVYGIHYTGSNENLVVICAAVDVFGLNKLKTLRIILIFVFVFSLVVVYFAGRLFAAKALKPISEVVEQVNTISISNLNSRISLGSGKDEIAQLSETFNNMLDRLETAFRTRKDFITNSSHELRTPLTVITGQLEVTLLKERKADEYKTALISVLEDIKNLNQLANRLLILSRVENDFSEKEFNPVRIDDILWRSRAEILKHFGKYTVNIQFDKSIEEEDHFKIAGNDQLLKTAFSNLIENGCKYSADHAINVSLMVDKDNIHVIFKDKGIGIPEEEIDHIFQPFYRAKNVKRNKGHGIGLSLVQKIIHLHNGTIDVKSQLKKGTEFTISLPLH